MSSLGDAFKIPTKVNTPILKGMRAARIVKDNMKWEHVATVRAKDGTYHMIQAVVLYDPKDEKKGRK